MWRATVTPLASIIGSGFLIAAPLLNDLSGHYAIYVMVTLCVFAYSIGQIIRWNIQHVEPNLAAQQDRHLLQIERLSDIALTAAYVLSVTYYLYLFSSFIVRIFSIQFSGTTQTITTVVLLLMAFFGYFRGFKILEKIEIFAVNIKLSIITVFLCALLFFNLDHQAPSHVPSSFDMKHIPIIMGLLIMIQGFETSRYLGKEYSAEIRVKSMRNAQLLSTGIYIIFILLFSLVFQLHPLDGEISDTSVIDIAKYAFWGAPIFLFIAAVTSQLSAALADFAGNGGLVNEVSQQRVSVKVAYVFIAAACIVLVWSFDIFEIISFASKGFALYYFFQCLSSMWVHFRIAKAKFVFSLCVGILCLLVVFFGQPFES
ncbi:hypothetical protein [Acinetobacter venetianus]|uniref:hypothetical protein n=1 Tax=Acinetobacter venetianus TaxID=52133 RepID=UPI001D0D70C0|nr:hypothetical protein [Acinetobacter venetianus]